MKPSTQILILKILVGILALLLCTMPLWAIEIDSPSTTIQLQVEVATPNEILIQTGRDWGVLSLRTGVQHPLLQQLAEEHAAYQARVQVQGHQGFDRRVAILQQSLPGYEFAEVANESWPGQDVRAAAYEMYRSWKLSPGHWSAVNGRCTYWGYAMVLGRNGTWYAAGIFATR